MIICKKYNSNNIMAVIPKKKKFQLHFRNKTKTRKILNRDFRLQKLLKKDSNNLCRFINPPIKFVEVDKNLLKNSLKATLSLKIKNLKIEDIKIINKSKLHVIFNKDLKEVKMNKGLISNFIKLNNFFNIYKDKPLFKPFWFLASKTQLYKNYDSCLKKLESSNITSVGPQINYNSFLKPQQFCNTNSLLKKHAFLNKLLKPNNIFLKKKTIYTRANRLLFGRYGICFKQSSIISAKSVETAKLDIAKTLRKKGRFWIRICCDIPVSERPAETRMGKGKGSISHWTTKVSPGQCFLEFNGISIAQLKEIYQNLSKKSAVGLKSVY